jgi:curved DNA-binding protein CbpA
MVGSLSERDPADVLSEILRRQVSGTLTLRDEGCSRQLFLDAGSFIRFAASTHPEESLIGWLLKHGGVTQAQIKEATEAKQESELLGTVLVRLGHLTRAGLNEISEKHVRRVLSGTLSMKTGRWDFQQGALPFREQLDSGVRTAEALLEWTRTLKDADWIRGRLGPVDARVHRDRRPPEGYQTIRLDPVEGYIMSRVDGAATIREICMVSPMGDEKALAALFGLSLAGILEPSPTSGTVTRPMALEPPPPRPQPREQPQSAAAPARPIPVPSSNTPTAGAPGKAPQAAAPLPAAPASAGAPAAVKGAAPPAQAARPAAVAPAPAAPSAAAAQAAAAAAPAKSPAPGTGAPPAPARPATHARPGLRPGGRTPLRPGAKRPAPPARPRPVAAAPAPAPAPQGAGELESEMLQRHAEIYSLDLYQVLGVGQGAPTDVIRHAYYELARRFHPDKFRDDALKAKAEQVFGRITEAYSTLSVQEARSRYDGERASRDHRPADKQGETGVLARENFRRGKEEMEHGRFNEALVFLMHACEQDPNRAEYFEYLGATQAKNPRLRRQAEESLLHSLALSPTSAGPYLHLGSLYERSGHHDKSREMYKKALEWDPDNEEARQALGQEHGPRKGFLGLFSRK